ncbi:MAG: hypothetical protein IT211_15855 [Armatimonadetes bacterium]|nr:hypothetical protein [Armatimonadota bacterium]
MGLWKGREGKEEESLRTNVARIRKVDRAEQVITTNRTVSTDSRYSRRFTPCG